MLKYFSADYILPVSSPPLKRGVIAIDEDGVVKALYANADDVPSGTKIQQLSGVLIPGLVNAHCHLELSHLKGVIPEKGGLIDFVKQVINNRKKENKAIEKAMSEADSLMYKNGIQAVGDHANTSISAKIKERSKIQYHTFVEIIGFQDGTEIEKIDEARDIEFYFNPEHTSITPHSAYSCSKGLFKAFKKAVSEDNIVSVHNQESDEENKLYRYKKGEFLKFYDEMGIDYSTFKAQARNSVQSYLPYLPTSNKTILVHNTYTTIKDLDFISRMGKKVILCLCPKSNLYIENALPKLTILNYDSDIVIGTDSFASNNTLDVMEELKTLHKHFPALDFANTIKWVTLNGAVALGFEDSLGSFEVGKTPGLVLLKNMKQLRLTDDVTVERIV